MEEKKIIKLFILIGAIILLLDFLFIFLYFFFLFKKHCSYELKQKILDYMYKNNLDEENYNFHKVFWSSSEGEFFSEGLFEGIAFISNIIYGIISIIGFIFDIIYLLKRKLCAIIFSTILFLVTLFPPIFDLIIAFDSQKKLTNEDLSDFGELNDDINNAYDSFITSRIIMKISSIFLFVSPFCYIITPFIVVHLLLNKKNNNELNEQPITQVNKKGDNTLGVKQEDILYNE